MPGALAAREAAAEEMAAGSAGPATAAASDAAASAAAGTTAVDYGLRGLRDVIRKEDRALAEVALGQDLTQLGLELKISSIVSTIGLPFADVPTSRQPIDDLPAVFRVRVPGLRSGHLSRMDETTLIFAFYSMPRDMIQLAAARELYQRGWLLHTETRIWVLPTMGPDGKPASLELFNITEWRRKPVQIEELAKVMAAVLPQEEVEKMFQTAVKALTASSDAPTAAGAPGAAAGAGAATSGGGSGAARAGPKS